jgi:hypothetical protein
MRPWNQPTALPSASGGAVSAMTVFVIHHLELRARRGQA